MSASANDKFMKAGEAGTVTTLSAPSKALSATSITVGSTTNYNRYRHGIRCGQVDDKRQ